MVTVSVIVPNYNHARFLGQRLDTVLNQSFRDFELIILDDCSSDESRALIEQYRNRPGVKHVIYNETNSGSTFRQWQKGISLASGKYIWIAESDDYADPGFLAAAVAELDRGADLFYCRSVRVDEEGKECGDMNKWYADISAGKWLSGYEASAAEELNTALVLKNTIVNASAVLFRRSDKIGNYLEQLEGMRYCGDWLFWLMYLHDSMKISYSVRVSNYFRIHAGVTRRTFDPELRNRELLRVLGYLFRLSGLKKRRRYLTRYYFNHHFTVFGRRDIRRNASLFLRQLCLSRYFFSCWLKYVLTGQLPV